MSPSSPLPVASSDLVCKATPLPPRQKLASPCTRLKVLLCPKTANAPPQPLSSYAYVEYDDEAKKPKRFHFINSSTTYRELGILFRIQTKRRKKNLSNLFFYQVDSLVPASASDTTGAPASTKYAILRLVIENGKPSDHVQKSLPFVTSPKRGVAKGSIQTTFNVLQESYRKMQGREQDALNPASINSMKIPEKLVWDKLRIPAYVQPSEELLLIAYDAIQKILPPQDIEARHPACVVARLYAYWKPEKVKVILLAESHIYTKQEDTARFQIDPNILSPSEYDGPRQFAAVHLCLGYGEADALSAIDGEAPAPEAATKGTTHFWSLLEALSSFGNNKASLNEGHVLKTKKNGTKREPAGDLQSRLLYKLKILQDLKDRGIWLVDACFLGWYIPQESEYYITWKSKLLHTIQKPRPPQALYKPTFVLSWELYTKHVIRQAAIEGKSLRLVVPIGKGMEAAVTKQRIQEAVNLPRMPSSAYCDVCDAFDQPNAWLKNGKTNSEITAEIVKLVQEEAPCNPIV